MSNAAKQALQERRRVKIRASVSESTHMDQFIIRRLVETDASVFRAMRLESLRLHPEAFGASFEDEQQKTLADFSERLRRSVIFGGFASDNSLHGIVAVARNDASKTRHIASIWGMYVRKEVRGRGLSRALISAAINEAAHHCRSIRLSVVSTNEAARCLYQSFGFKEWALDTGALNVDGIFYDEVLMRLDLE